MFLDSDEAIQVVQQLGLPANDLASIETLENNPASITWWLGSEGEENERDAEYDFVVPRVSGTRILDVGHADGQILELFPSAVGVDQRRNAKKHQADREFVADLVRGLPFADRSFDTVTCISTLEHVGCGHYGDAVYDDAGVHKAFAELARVSNERILVTVPLYLEIPGFVNRLGLGTLRRWGTIADWRQLQLCIWPSGVGRHLITVVAAAMYMVKPAGDGGAQGE
ncbi:MAG: class I SAM-dependent methyltransferase [Thermomicrobiales bacterium]